MEWQPINTSPKYPIDINGQGPHFLVKCWDGYVHEVWWQYPAVGSIDYENNTPPSIVRIIEERGIGFVNVKADLWWPLPEPPILENRSENNGKP
ncbi:hypothetical protein [Thalassospira alkalitolerans]|uniref:hypothetical protein n=1 Tax=Thalassospira alkalitolerans TaxID=1293890 RepID=UPI003AA7E4D7